MWEGSIQHLNNIHLKAISHEVVVILVNKKEIQSEKSRMITTEKPIKKVRILKLEKQPWDAR